MSFESMFGDYLNNHFYSVLSAHNQLLGAHSGLLSSLQYKNGLIGPTAKLGRNTDNNNSLENGSQEEEEEDGSEARLYTDSIDELCQCTCSICQKSMTSKSLKEHIRKQHKLDAREYIKVYGEIKYSKLTYHRCKLCKKTLKAAVIVITNHLKKVHDLSFQQYRTMFNVFEGETSRTKIFIKNQKKNDENSDTCMDNSEEISDDAYTDDRRLDEDSSSDKFTDFLRNFYFNHFLNNFQNLNDTIKRLSGMSEASKHEFFCETEVSKRDARARNSSEDEEEEDSVGRVYTDSIKELCESECKLCGKRMTIKSLREHVRLRHEGNIQEYRQRFGDLTYTKLTYHRCKLCKKAMKAAVTTISDHLKKQHQITFQEYKQIFRVFLTPSKKFAKRRRNRPSVGDGGFSPCVGGGGFSPSASGSGAAAGVAAGRIV